ALSKLFAFKDVFPSVFGVVGGFVYVFKYEGKNQMKLDPGDLTKGALYGESGALGGQKYSVLLGWHWIISLNLMNVNLDDTVSMANKQRAASTFFSAMDKKARSPYVFHGDKKSTSGLEVTKAVEGKKEQGKEDHMSQEEQGWRCRQEEKKGRCECASIDEAYLDLADERMLKEMALESLESLYEDVLKSLG
nr:hypothetical protein [Tanacetum cinerariifolium]